MNRIGILILLSCVAGCGSSAIPRQAVYGTIVGAQGRKGVISFVPSEGTKGPAAQVAINNGNFRFSEATGPVPGVYSVTIRLDEPRNSNAKPGEKVVDENVVNVKGVDVPISKLGALPIESERMHSMLVIVPSSGTRRLDLQLKRASAGLAD